MSAIKPVISLRSLYAQSITVCDSDVLRNKITACGRDVLPAKDRRAVSFPLNRKITAFSRDVLPAKVGRELHDVLNRNIDIKCVPYYDEGAKKGRENYTSRFRVWGQTIPVI